RNSVGRGRRKNSVLCDINAWAKMAALPEGPIELCASRLALSCNPVTNCLRLDWNEELSLFVKKTAAWVKSAQGALSGPRGIALACVEASLGRHSSRQ